MSAQILGKRRTLAMRRSALAAIGVSFFLDSTLENRRQEEFNNRSS